MTILETRPVSSSTSAAALSKAVVRAADYLGLTKKMTAGILGFSESTASRLWSKDYQLSPQRKKEWELATLFFRMFRSLDSVMGEQESASTWLFGKNIALGKRPIELIQSTEGLIDVVRYLDAQRGLI